MLLEQFRVQQPSLSERIYVILVGLFLGVLLLTNIITSKYITIGHLTLTAGAITYPFTFSLLDIISEAYGKNKAKMVIWMGLMASLFMTFITYLANIIPIYEHSPVPQSAFQLVFGFTPGIVLGSMVAYMIAQLIDVYLFELIRRVTKGKYLWLRNNISTLVGQLFDTAIFAGIAWMIWPLLGLTQGIEPISWNTWYQITINEYMFKVFFSFINIPLVYIGVYLVKRYIKV
ncbi:hypothetical protein Aasi_0238 [Candidatus Amoebophilus asiaticus 5a2]|uniref:Probable queuosine precursor transporter n=1 Tax=Amoebophilus asiaticus (strain 5a2) TaxID=452471 RepID=B3ER29_AMOA5|nr:queuosine precursor transporter [Candidatus Amoebophilus asiaticus]ACE05681.1 hypothetical protein Aasi_0238 [Candidatus Amoebophilus asiaticus 5a2]